MTRPRPASILGQYEIRVQQMLFYRPRKFHLKYNTSRTLGAYLDKPTASIPSSIYHFIVKH
jgi:hypothetical protein